MSNWKPCPWAFQELLFCKIIHGLTASFVSHPKSYFSFPKLFNRHKSNRRRHRHTMDKEKEICIWQSERDIWKELTIIGEVQGSRRVRQSKKPIN